MCVCMYTVCACTEPVASWQPLQLRVPNQICLYKQTTLTNHMLSQLQVYELATELQEYFDQLVMENSQFPSGAYQTRSKSAVSAPSIIMKSSCSNMPAVEVNNDSLVSSNVPVPSRTSRRLKAKKRGRSTDSEVDIYDNKSQDLLKNPPPIRKRPREAVDKYGGYGLRTRNGSQQISPSPKSSSAENSEEEISMASRQSEEEEAYLDDLDSEESHASGSKRVRRSTRRTRKRAKIESESDDEETMTTISMSRSGRIVKPTIKFFS